LFTYLHILGLVIIGILLLWIGYTLFFSSWSPFFPRVFSLRELLNNWGKREKLSGAPDDPQVCPVCCRRLIRGELVKSIAFPSLSGGRERLMYIKGCVICLHENVPRRCPVCGSNLDMEDFLVSRMFTRTESKNHVHVLGCNKCKRV